MNIEISTHREIKAVEPDKIFRGVESEAGSVTHQIEDYDDWQSQNGIAGNFGRLTLTSILTLSRETRMRTAGRGGKSCLNWVSSVLVLVLDLRPGGPVMVRRVVGGVQADRVVVAAAGSGDSSIGLPLLITLYYPTLRNFADWKLFGWWHRYKYLLQPDRWTELFQCRVILKTKTDSLI